MAGTFASQRPKIASGLPWADNHLPGTADTKNQSRKAVGGIFEARNGVSKQILHCHIPLARMPLYPW